MEDISLDGLFLKELVDCYNKVKMTTVTSSVIWEMKRYIQEGVNTLRPKQSWHSPEESLPELDVRPFMILMLLRFASTTVDVNKLIIL